VTGAGTGIGAAIARVYAAAGAAVTVTGRRAEPLAGVVDDVGSAGGVAWAVTADVTELDAMQRAVDGTVERFGRLDIVVANAGIAPPLGPALDMPLAEWQTILDIDLTGVFVTAKAAVPALRAAGGGALIVLGSGAGRANTGGLGAYSAAKAGVTALCRVLAAELRNDRIAVNELVPGPVRTPALDILSSGTEEERAERLRAIGEWLKEPEDVARLALYLATLPVDGATGQVFSLAGRLL
jgi:NAD(P)-dependent dehydrogenase (short-subunit alcohol dehydrogenase family)